MTSAQDNQSL